MVQLIPTSRRRTGVHVAFFLDDPGLSEAPAEAWSAGLVFGLSLDFFFFFDCSAAESSDPGLGSVASRCRFFPPITGTAAPLLAEGWGGRCVGGGGFKGWVGRARGGTLAFTWGSWLDLGGTAEGLFFGCVDWRSDPEATSAEDVGGALLDYLWGRCVELGLLRGML